MATRLYLPASGTPGAAPLYDSAWEDVTIASVLPAVTTKTSTTMTQIDFPDDNNDADRDILFRQYVSDAMDAQTITSQTVKWQIRAMEDAAVNNLFTTISIRVCNNDGSSIEGTILSITRDGTEVVNGVLTNRQFSATTSELTVENGDRLVIEIGLGGDPGNNQDHAGSLSIGDDSGTDLPEDDTTTSAYNPWVEFSQDIDGLVGAAAETHTSFITIIGKDTGWVWNSGQFDVDSGMRATSNSPTNWVWAPISSSSSYFFPSGGDTYWTWVSGNAYT